MALYTVKFTPAAGGPPSTLQVEGIGEADRIAKEAIAAGSQQVCIYEGSLLIKSDRQIRGQAPADADRVAPSNVLPIATTR